MTTMATIERKYAMTRLGRGDYLLPANDAKSLWRITTYVEGPSSGLMDWPRDRQMWAAYRWRWALDDPRLAESIDTWEGWEFWHGMNESRQEAIDTALKDTDPPVF